MFAARPNRYRVKPGTDYGFLLLYKALAETDDVRRTAYRTVFADALPVAVLTAIRGATNAGFALGNERLQRQIGLMAGRDTRRGKLGRANKRKPDADQLDLPM